MVTIGSCDHRTHLFEFNSVLKAFVIKPKHLRFFLFHRMLDGSIFRVCFCHIYYFGLPPRSTWRHPSETHRSTQRQTKNFPDEKETRWNVVMANFVHFTVTETFMRCTKYPTTITAADVWYMPYFLFYLFESSSSSSTISSLFASPLNLSVSFALYLLDSAMCYFIGLCRNPTTKRGTKKKRRINIISGFWMCFFFRSFSRDFLWIFNASIALKECWLHRIFCYYYYYSICHCLGVTVFSLVGFFFFLLLLFPFCFCAVAMEKFLD